MTLIRKKTQVFFEEIAKNNQRFAQFLMLLFLAIGAIGILNHAMWRDELNGWLLTRDSHTISELFANVRYEGHPLLWYICLDLLNRLTANPVAMQILHLFIATTSIYLFVNFAPFSRLQKIAFVFSYLPFYEYLLISRNYAIGLLSVFLFCVCFETRKKNYSLLAIILALMANTNAYCLFIAIALLISLTLEYCLRKQFNYLSTATRFNIASSLVIVLLGAGISIATLIPPMDSNLQGGAVQWMLRFDLHQLVSAISRLWNSYILILLPKDSELWQVSLFAVLSVGIFAFVATILIKKPIALFFYAIATIEILVFTYIKFLGSPRHYGHLYIVFILSLWLASYYPRSQLTFARKCSVWFGFVNRYKTIFIAIVLFSQLAAGIVSFSRDLTIPYSASRDTARYIQTHNLEELFIVGSEDFAIAPICAYLNRKIYYPESQKLGSFVLFNSQRKPVNIDEVLARVDELSREKNRDILLILNHELKASQNVPQLSYLTKFTNAFIHNEQYYLYRYNKSK